MMNMTNFLDKKKENYLIYVSTYLPTLNIGIA